MKTTDVSAALLKWGCPIHYTNLAMYIEGYNDFYTRALPKSRAEVTRKHLSKLVQRGAIRRVRPGVYSAYSSERD